MLIIADAHLQTMHGGSTYVILHWRLNLCYLTFVAIIGLLEDEQDLATILVNDGTQWKFNSPATPHFGGKWEADIKSIKYHLRRVVGSHLLTYEELTTLLT